MHFRFNAARAVLAVAAVALTACEQSPTSVAPEAQPALGLPAHVRPALRPSFSVQAAPGEEIVTYDFNDLRYNCSWDAAFPATYRDLQVSGNLRIATCSNGSMALIPANSSGGYNSIVETIFTLPRPATAASFQVQSYGVYEGRALVAYGRQGEVLATATHAGGSYSSGWTTLRVEGEIHAIGMRDRSATAYWDDLRVTYGRRDDTPPVIAPSISGTLGQNGWYTSDVAVSWLVTDAESADQISLDGCAALAVTADTDGATSSCGASSPGGTAPTQTVTIKRDATAPAIVFSGNAGSYTVDQTVAIACSASDATSGIAAESCPGASGEAHTFAVGDNSLSATATDAAGNAAAATAGFTVVVNADAVSNLVVRWVDKAGIANSMTQQLKNGATRAFINHVEAQSGKSLSAAHAAILIDLARRM